MLSDAVSTLVAGPRSMKWSGTESSGFLFVAAEFSASSKRHRLKICDLHDLRANNFLDSTAGS